MRSVLWADDDSEEQLRGLVLILKSRGVVITDRVREYIRAREILKQRSDDGVPFKALLVDMILPYAPQKPSLHSYLGLRLAEDALTSGVQAIAFLSVVRQIEVSDKYRALQVQFPAAKVAYFDKLALLEGNTIGELVGILSLGDIKKS